MNQQISGTTYKSVQRPGLTRKQDGAMRLNQIIAARNEALKATPGAVLDSLVPVPTSVTLHRVSAKPRSTKWQLKMRSKNPSKYIKEMFRGNNH